MTGPALRVVQGGRDQSLADARKRARPLNREWLKAAHSKVAAKLLDPVDFLLAEKMTNYPSANFGYCYAGQKSLGKSLGRSARTARRSQKRLCDQGLLVCKRGGPGQTARWIFCIDGKPVFGVPTGGRRVPADRTLAAQERTSVAGLERTQVAGLERTQVATKPLEQDPLEQYPIEQEPAPLPPSEARRDRKGSADMSSRPISEIIELVCLRLGCGDKDSGWGVYQQLPHDVKQELRTQARYGTLDDAVVDYVLMSRELSNRPQR